MYAAILRESSAHGLKSPVGHFRIVADVSSGDSLRQSAMTWRAPEPKPVYPVPSRLAKGGSGAGRAREVANRQHDSSARAQGEHDIWIQAFYCCAHGARPGRLHRRTDRNDCADPSAPAGPGTGAFLVDLRRRSQRLEFVEPDGDGA
ncbi:hypothetical protein [Pseudomonas fluorescens]|nr:hypothetical protein [Pseudomonas fluorescens]